MDGFRLITISKTYPICPKCGNKDIEINVKEKEVEFKCCCGFKDTVKE